LLSDVDGWKSALREGSPEDQVLQIVFCREEERLDEKENPYTVVEVEYKYMGFHKRFHSRKEYEDYDSGRRQLRKWYLEIESRAESGELDGVDLVREREDWLTKCFGWNNKWGGSYTPEDLRMAIDRMLQEVNAGVWMLWKPFEIKETTPKRLVGVDHYKIETEGDTS
jgi:hypothetical protein